MASVFGTLSCSTILIGKKATVDGSVIAASSCDGDIMGVIDVMPAREYPPGTKLPMYVNYPRPQTYQEFVEQVRGGYDCVGSLSVERTYRSLLYSGYLTTIVTGGLNEFGVSMGIEFMPMRPELVNTRGVTSSCTNHWTTSLIANGLMRAKSAREAIRVIGAVVEEHGFRYYYAPTAGTMIPIADRDEVWMMEIFGPGDRWTPGDGTPGAVWCAQRIPDDEVGFNTNRSRIGLVDLSKPDFFIASSNIHSLAEELGLWKHGEPFVWHEVYGVPFDRWSCLREWAFMNRLCPSLKVKATGDAKVDRYPFSVKPEKKLGVPDVMEIMRDFYEGSEFDVTRHPAFNPGGKRSPLARPWGSGELFDLLGIKVERCIGTESSDYVFINQMRSWLPDPLVGCTWFTYGAAYTGCFTPLYSGVTELPESWSRPADFARIDRSQAQWNFRLVQNLVNIKYQEAIQDVEQLRRPAETGFLAAQAELEKEALRIFKAEGPGGLQKYLTEYASQCLKQVGYAYGELVDYLMLKYLCMYPEASLLRLPRIAPPAIPAVRSAGCLPLPPAPDRIE